MKERWSSQIVVSLGLSVALIMVSCGSKGGGTSESSRGPSTRKIDYVALGLWDEGPCDTTRPPLKVGMITTFASPLVSIRDQADALEAAAKAFNARGGANGACVEVHACDDGANADKALNCVRELDKAGVVVTVNDQGTAPNAAEISAAMAAAGIPRFAGNVTSQDWADTNAYPLDASGTGATLMVPAALMRAGVKKIGIVRVDIPTAGALKGLLEGAFGAAGATFPFDAPVPAGTTDYSQFILGAQRAGAEGIYIALSADLSTQVIRAAQQLKSPLKIGMSFGTITYSFVKELGNFARQMVFASAIPPATADLPVYEVLRGDLAQSHNPELQPENLKISAMRSWIGLYALLRILRDKKSESFTRSGVTAAIKAAKDVPMLGIFGDLRWTPDSSYPGLYKRRGIPRWEVWRWDPNRSFGSSRGNFSAAGTLDMNSVFCGTPLGAPPPC